MKKRLSKKAGLPPGSPVYTGTSKSETTFTLHRFDEKVFETFEQLKPSEAINLIGANAVNWFLVTGLTNTAAIEELAQHLEINPLILEDIFNVEHLPKVEETGNHLFVTLKNLRWSAKDNKAQAEQVSIYLGNNVIVTFQEAPNDLFDPIIERLKNGKGKGRLRQEDYLAYLIIDMIVDNYYYLLDQSEDEIENLEKRMFDTSSEDALTFFLNHKKNLVMLRRTIFPLKEEIRYLAHDDSDIITELTRQHLSDVHDHLSHIIQSIDTMRELTSTLMDLMMAHNANRMNSIMKTLTLVSTIFIPLTFLAGIYGMNFRYMPELEWKYGYFTFIGVVIAIGIGMYIFMKRRKWF